MCVCVKVLSLANTAGVTASALLKILPSCGCLEELDLTGLASVVTDSFVKGRLGRHSCHSIHIHISACMHTYTCGLPCPDLT